MGPMGASSHREFPECVQRPQRMEWNALDGPANSPHFLFFFSTELTRAQTPSRPAGKRGKALARSRRGSFMAAQRRVATLQWEAQVVRHVPTSQGAAALRGGEERGLSAGDTKTAKSCESWQQFEAFRGLWLVRPVPPACKRFRACGAAVACEAIDQRPQLRSDVPLKLPPATEKKIKAPTSPGW
eukprot:scaffold470_cov257-Pinguiococcus_pyrenoidosus.AAC.39